MHVSTLIRLLRSCNPDALVMIASDEEGNSFHQLADLKTDSEEANTVILWPGAKIE